jgi:signal transduction histidine kinase
MHPLLAPRSRFLTYLALWTILMSLLLYPAWHVGAGLGLVSLFYALVCLSPWYLCRVRPLRIADLVELVGTWMMASLVAGVLLAGAARTAFAMASAFRPTPAPRYDLLMAMGAMAYLMAAGVHYTVLAMQQTEEAARRSAEARELAAQARELAREAELYALRLQLNPHFLFNSLHSIAALALMDGARAHRMTVRLGEFLRATLDLGGRDRIPLSQELALAHSYLDIERVRFGERLRVEEEIEEGCGECAVPALLLQPLVENAVKHGAAARVEGGAVRLSVRRSGGDVVITVENECDAPSADGTAEPPSRTGIGMPHVRRRLQACYGEAARFECGLAEGADATTPVYCARLRLPCEPSIASSNRV